ncbi:MAG: DNA replication/repair protein RecF [Rhodobacteraceae bacterium]|nr:DNA replication/repair protein RecF [Paracoccaceae bacterium]
MATLAVHGLTLSHFRSHKNARLEPDGRPIAIFGPNGAGKTNILEAISLLSPGRGLRGAKVEEMARSPENLGWKVSAELESLGQTHEIETAWTNNGSRGVLIDGKPAPQLALGRIARIVWLVPVMDRLWVEGAEGRRRFLDRLSMSFEPGHGEAALTYERAMRERNRMLKDQIRDPAWYGAVEAQMAGAALTIHANRLQTLTLLADAQTGAETSFPAADLSLIHADGLVLPDSEDDLQDLWSENRQRDMVAGRTLAGPHRSDIEAVYLAKGLHARKCSTGEQKALLVSLILANSRALAAEFGAPPILLLDEVAAHLDADRRAALYDEICALGAQAWMTGTGVELFDAFQDKAMMLEVYEENGLSVVTQR